MANTVDIYVEPKDYLQIEERSFDPQTHSVHILNKILTEVSQKINENTNENVIFDFIFSSLDLIIPYDRIGIGIIENELVSLKWFNSKGVSKNLKLGYSAPLSGSSLEKILLSGHPRIINDLQKYLEKNPHSESTKLAISDGIRSSLTCPLKSEDKLIGFVFFSSYKPDTYNLKHINIFIKIANELSIVIEQARLRRFFETNKLKSQSIRMMLHDLKSPLSVIQGFIELAMGEDWYQELPDEKKNIFSILLRNTKFMFEMTAELSEINLLDSPNHVLKKENILLKKFLEEFTSHSFVLAQKKDIQFTYSLSDQLPKELNLEAGKIREVLDNLFSNALKFSHRGSSVELSVVTDGERVYFSVIDHGQGIPKEEIPKLFNEYSKTSTRPTEGESSTGLGLSIVRRIVEQHGGKIYVESEFGTGSKFTFWIPCTEI